MNRLRNQLCVLMVMWCVLSASIPLTSIWAHPFHFTTAEMEFNPKTQRFEVSMRVLASDLESALARARHNVPANSSAQHNNRDRELQIEKSSERAETNSRVASSELAANSDELMLIQYVESNFTIRAKPISSNVDKSASVGKREKLSALPKQSVIHWVGKEEDQAWVWLYFEVEPVAAETGWTLMNQLFMELNESQVNTCVIRFGAQRISLKTEAKNCTVDLPLIFQK